MGDALVFILILFVFYLGECVQKFPRWSSIFQASIWWVPNPGHPSQYFSSDAWGLFLVNPLPPLTTVFHAHDWSIPKSVEEIRDAFDEDRLEEALETYWRQTFWLRLVCNGMFGYVFVLAPVWLWKFGGAYLALLLGGLVIGFVLPVGIFFGRAFLRMGVGGGADLIGALIPVLLFPPATIRACDRLSVHWLEKFHPVLLAHKFASEPRFMDFAGRTIRDLSHPADDSRHPDDNQRKGTLEQMTRLLTRIGVSPERFLVPAGRMNEESLAYCPRCHEEYLRADGACSDCPGVLLRPFE